MRFEFCPYILSPPQQPLEGYEDGLFITDVSLWHHQQNALLFPFYFSAPAVGRIPVCKILSTLLFLETSMTIHVH